MQVLCPRRKSRRASPGLLRRAPCFGPLLGPLRPPGSPGAPLPPSPFAGRTSRLCDSARVDDIMLVERNCLCKSSSKYWVSNGPNNTCHETVYY